VLCSGISPLLDPLVDSYTHWSWDNHSTHFGYLRSYLGEIRHDLVHLHWKFASSDTCWACSLRSSCYSCRLPARRQHGGCRHRWALLGDCVGVLMKDCEGFFCLSSRETGKSNSSGFVTVGVPCDRLSQLIGMLGLRRSSDPWTYATRECRLSASNRNLRKNYRVSLSPLFCTSLHLCFYLIFLCLCSC
jgi:hypothetical protein